MQQKPCVQKVKIPSRRLNLVKSDFKRDLLAGFSGISDTNIDDLALRYDTVVNQLIDKHAPVKISVRGTRLSFPWYNQDIHKARRVSRRLERRWRKSKLESDHQLYIVQRAATNEMIDQAKQTYFRNELDHADSKTVFKKVIHLLNKGERVLPLHDSARDLANDFSNFFNNKVQIIYEELEKDQSDSDCLDQQTSVDCSLSDFDFLCEEDVRNAIIKAPTKSCSLDPVPT